MCISWCTCLYITLFNKVPVIGTLMVDPVLYLETVGSSGSVQGVGLMLREGGGF